MTAEQRERFLPAFLEDDRYHLALRRPRARRRYRARHQLSPAGRRPMRPSRPRPRAAAIDWIINGAKDCVANAPIAKLFAVEARDRARARRCCWCRATRPASPSREHAGAALVSRRLRRGDRSRTAACRRTTSCAAPAARRDAGRGAPLAQALNLGIGRAAYEAALDYAELARPGRPPHHRAPGDRHEARRDRDPARGRAQRHLAGGLGLRPSRRRTPTAACPTCRSPTIAQVFTAEAIYRAAKDAAECFGAMGVMRDMPLQKYIHDALHLPAHRRRQQRRQAAHRRGAGGLPARRAAARRGIRKVNSHGLLTEQRAARLADDGAQIRRGGDQADLARARRDRRSRTSTFDWDIIEKGSQARLPHHGGAEGIRRRRHRLRHAGAGDGGARARRQRDLQDLQPELEVEPPDRRGLQRRAEGALPASRSSPTTASCSARASPSRPPAPTTACRRRTRPRPG